MAGRRRIPMGARGGGIPSGVANVTGTRNQPRMGRQRQYRTVTWDQSNAGPVVVSLSGAWVTGRAWSMIGQMIDEMVDVLAFQGFADVRQNLDASIQFPTPYYETQVTVQDDPDGKVVHDRGIVYGPWLEGVSERNRRTRFKGYHSFRKAADELRRKAVRYCEPVAAKWVGKINS
jgi:hypothetical protein